MDRRDGRLWENELSHGSEPQACDPPHGRLTAALILATALIYTSFTAGRDELTASQLLKRAKPGQSYILAGTVLAGSVRYQGEDLLFRVAIRSSIRCPSVHGHRARPVRGRTGRAGHGSGGGNDVRRPAEFAHDQVPVQVPGGGFVVMARGDGITLTWPWSVARC